MRHPFFYGCKDRRVHCNNVKGKDRIDDKVPRFRPDPIIDRRLNDEHEQGGKWNSKDNAQDTPQVSALGLKTDEARFDQRSDEKTDRRPAGHIAVGTHFNGIDNQFAVYVLHRIGLKVKIEKPQNNNDDP